MLAAEISSKLDIVDSWRGSQLSRFLSSSSRFRLLHDASSDGIERSLLLMASSTSSFFS